MNQRKTDIETAKKRRKATIITAVSAFLLCSVFFILMQLRVPNMHVVFGLVSGFFSLFLVYMILWTLCASEKYSRAAVILRRCYLGVFAVGVVFFFTMLGLVISDAHTEEAEVDCIVVLGAGLHGDVPSYVLRLRLNEAVKYMQTQDSIPVIVAGGMGPGETITEAEAMARYLVAREIDESLIWKEGNSTRTQENIEFSLALMEEMGLDIENATVALVTNGFHLYRAKHIAQKLGVDAVGVAAPTPTIYLRVLYFSRETFALAAELLGLKLL